jgi:hypothetical protein
MVFPNPAFDVANISLPNGILADKVEIYNSQGSMVMSINDWSSLSANQLNIQELKAGVYSLKMYTSTKLLTSAFTKN